MATLYKQGTGYALQVGVGAARRTKRLGKLSRDGVAAVRFHVTQIETCKKTATVLRVSTASWLDGITDDLHVALAGIGLVQPRVHVTDYGIELTVGKLFDDYLARRADLKKFTTNVLKQAKQQCIELRRVGTAHHSAILMSRATRQFEFRRVGTGPCASSV